MIPNLRAAQSHQAYVFSKLTFFFKAQSLHMSRCFVKTVHGYHPSKAKVHVKACTHVYFNLKKSFCESLLNLT